MKHRSNCDLFKGIKNYTPIDMQEQKDVEMFLSSIAHFDNILTRDNIFTHTHLALTYLLEADDTEQLIIKSDVK